MTDFNIEKEISEVNFKPSNDHFDFPSFPWVCQKRFTEICDPSTLQTFAEINDSTKNLAKRCHTIKKVEIIIHESSCNYTLSCYCNENEFCREANGFNLSSLKNKLDHVDYVCIKNWYGKSDIPFFFSLCINLNSIKRLLLRVRRINSDDLKQLILPGLKELDFTGGIHSDYPFDKFVDFIKDLSKLHVFDFGIMSINCILPFEFTLFLQELQRCQDLIVHFNGILLLVLNQNYLKKMSG